MSEESKITLIPEMIPESTKEELLNPSANLIGQALRGVLHLICDPFVKLNAVRNQSLLDFEQKIIAKNEEIPIENRDDSKKNLALKAIDDAKFQLDSDELREMFANLISSTLDSRKNNLVQPSFSTILKDLSSDDAQILLHFINDIALPIVDIRINTTDKKAWANLKENILLLENEIIYQPVSIISLERLGLITLNDIELQSVKNIARYDMFRASDFYKEHEDVLPINSQEFLFTEMSIQKNNVQLTSLGENFLKVVS